VNGSGPSDPLGIANPTRRLLVRQGMKLKIVPACLVIAAIAGLAVNAAQNSNRRFSDFTTGPRDGPRAQIRIAAEGNQPVTDCSQVRVQFDGKDAITAEDQIRIPRSQISVLRFRASANGGVYASGSTGNDYVVRTCKAVPGDDPLASQALQQIQTSESGGRLSVTGQPGGAWSVTVLIEAPRDAALDLETLNGPVDLLNLGGQIQLRAVNGPVGIHGLSGEVKVSATNGPVLVELDGSGWSGRGLDASATNGPLSVRLPDSYNSALRINVSERNPISCRAAQCGQAIRRPGSPEVIEIGGPDAPVTLSVLNGPLSIERAR
jgi:hypothetical protein